METRDLQTFLAVVGSGGITKAAELLGRSQPSVTRTIQDLEAELGFDLFHRVGRRVQLSEEGVAFEEEARRILMSFTELAARAKAIAGGKGRILQVATTSAIGTCLLPKALAHIGTVRLPPEVHVAQLLPSAVAQEVRAGRGELGFSSLPLDAPGLDVLRLFSAPDVVALRDDDPLAHHRTVPLAAFHARALITLLDPLRFQGRIARVMEERGVVPASILRTNVSVGALQMVRDTGVAAIIDPVSAHGLALPGILIRPLDVSVPFHWGIIAGVGRPLRPLAADLVDAVEVVALRTIPGLRVLDPSRAGEIAAGPPFTDPTQVTR